MTAYRSAYRYPLPRRYRRVRSPYRYRARYRSRGNSGGALPIVVAGVVLAAGAGAGAKAVVHHASPGSATGNRAAAAVIAFARARVGRVPYLWGGTTDAGMDCSGLTQAAYAAAHVTIERTSQQQWASERHVSVPAPGDLVFFAGSDGTPSAPGHVGIVTGKDTMIDEYGAGTYARYDTFGAKAAPGTGLGTVVGFTDPAPAPVPPAAAVTGGEAGFMRAVLSGIGAPATAADVSSLEAWVRHETPWPPVAANNPMNTTLTAPGSSAFNYLPGGGSVQSYPTAAEGVHATAVTLLGGYPLIVSALRSGAGLCGNPALAGEFSKWSGNGYSGVC